MLTEFYVKKESRLLSDKSDEARFQLVV